MTVHGGHPSTFNQGEVGVYFRQFRFPRLLSEFLYKPLDRIVVPFRVVATSLTSFLRVAQGQNIPGDRSGTIRTAQWNPMICGDSVPKSHGTTANRTAPMPIFETTLPIFRCESVRERHFAGAAAFFQQTFEGSAVEQVNLCVLALVLAYIVGVFLLPSVDPFQSFRLALRLITVALVASFHSSWELLILLPALFEHFIVMSVEIVCRFLATAVQTLLFNAIRLLLISSEQRTGKPLSTTTTNATNWFWLVDHQEFSFAGFAYRWGQAAKQAVRSDDQSELVTHILDYTTESATGVVYA